MSLITESELRKQYRARSLTDGTVYEVSPGTILTPLAKSFLSDHKIDLHWVKTLDEEQVNVNEPVNEPVVASVVASASNDKLQRTTNLDVDPTLGGKKRFRTLYGGFLETKPEHMTHLYGNMLVFKDHPRIVFRGKLDSLEQKILEAQLRCSKLSMTKLVNDLQEILEFIRRIVRCEVMGEDLGEFNLLGMTPKELREQSHFPKKYYGLDHFQPSYDMGEAVVVINALRTFTRETELLAYKAFKKENGDAEREDIILSLNRLSSLFWIMMFRIRVGQYD